MFRKYYKDANNDIKADEEFINSVIKNAHSGHAPSPVKKYYRYAATLAAAAVVVSAAVISMPLLTDKHDDGIIIETTVTETAQPQEDKTTSPIDVFPIPEQTQNPSAKAVPTLPAINYFDSQNSAEEDTSEHSYNLNLFSAFSKSETADKKTTEEIEQKNVEAEREESSITSFKITENISESITADETSKADNGADDTEVGGSPVTATTDSASGNVNSVSSSGHATGGGDGIFHDLSVPAPSGYSCQSSSRNYYVFTSDSGAVINVSIEYSGRADTVPSYNIDGDNISVSFTSNGASVSINAIGAEQASVDEIINSLR